jgi:hypothetical protein
MKMKTWALAGMMAMAAGLGMSMSTTTEAAGAGNQCIRVCQAEYTQCWYACTPGQGWCYDMCRTNYDGCVSDCG